MYNKNILIFIQLGFEYKPFYSKVQTRNQIKGIKNFLQIAGYSALMCCEFFFFYFLRCT